MVGIDCRRNNLPFSAHCVGRQKGIAQVSIRIEVGQYQSAKSLNIVVYSVLLSLFQITERSPQSFDGIGETLAESRHVGVAVCQFALYICNAGSQCSLSGCTELPGFFLCCISLHFVEQAGSIGEGIRQGFHTLNSVHCHKLPQTTTWSELMV